jgi:hypothetical protein
MSLDVEVLGFESPATCVDLALIHTFSARDILSHEVRQF